MATQTNIPESIPVTEGDSERTFHESCTEELKKIDDGSEKLPESGQNLANTNTMKEEAAGTLQGETSFRTTSPSKDACEETCTISEHDQTEETMNGTQIVIESKNHLPKDEEIEIESEKNEGMEKTKEIEEKGNDNPDDLDTTGTGNPESMIEERSGLKEDKKWITETAQETESKPTKQFLDDKETTLSQNTEALYHDLDPTVSAVCNSEASIDNNFITKSTHIEPEVKETHLKEKENESDGPFQAGFTSENEQNKNGEVNQIAYDELEDYSISIQKQKADNENVENILEIEDGDIVDNSPVTLINDRTPVEEVIEDKSNLNTPKESTRSTENIEVEEHLEEGNSEHEKIPEQTFLLHEAVEEEKLQRDLNVTSEIKKSDAASESVETCVQHEISMNIPDENFEKQVKPAHIVEKDFSLLDLNEVAERGQAEIPTEDEINFQVTDSILKDTKQNNEETSTDSSESMALEHTSTEYQGTQEGISVTNNADAENAREMIENEMQKTKETVDKETHEIATKCDETETGCLADNTMARVRGLGEDLSEQTSSELSAKDYIYGAEGDAKSHINKTEELPDLVAGSQDIHNAEKEAESFKREVIEETGELHGIHERNQDNEIPEKDHDSAFSTNEEEREQGEVKETYVTAASPNLEDKLDNKETNKTCDSNETVIAEEQEIKSLPHMSEKPEHTDSYLNLSERETSAGKLKTDYTLESAIELEDRDSEKTTDEVLVSIHQEDTEDKINLDTATENTSNTENDKVGDHLNRESSEHEKIPEKTILQHDEPEEGKLERRLNVTSEIKESFASSENIETCIQDEISKEIAEEIFDKQEKPTHVVEIPEHVVPIEKVTERVHTEIPKEDEIDFHATGSILEDGKQDNQQPGQTCIKFTENTTLQHTSTECKGTQEEISDTDTADLGAVREKIEDEIQKNEGTEKNRCIAGNTMVMVHDLTSAGEVLSQQTSLELNSTDYINGAEGDVKSNINKSEEVHDRPMIPNQQDIAEKQIIEGSLSLHSPESIQKTETNDDGKETEKSWVEGNKEHIIKESDNIAQLPDLVAEIPDFHDAENEAEHFKGEVTEETEVQASRTFVHEINPDNDNAFSKNQEKKELEEVKETSIIAADPNLEADIEKEMKDTFDSNETGIPEEKDIKLLPDLSKKTECTDSYLNMNEREASERKLKMESAEEIEDMDSEKTTEEDENIIVVIPPQLDDDETTKRFKEESYDDEVNTTGEDTRELPKEEHVDFKTPSPIFIEEKILQGSYKEVEVSDEFKIGISCTDNEKQKIDEYATPVLSPLHGKEKVISESLQEHETTELKEQVENSNLELKEHTETSENIGALNSIDTSVVQATEKMTLLAKDEPIVLQDDSELASADEDKINLDSPTENNSNTKNETIEDHLNRENSEHEIIPEDNEPQEEKLEKDLNVTSEIKESIASCGGVETCIQDEISIEIAEERFDKQEKPTSKVEITENVVPIEKLPDLVAGNQDIHDAENEAEPFKGEVIEETGELQGIHERNQDNEITEKDHESAFSTNEEEREQGEVKETFVTAASPNLEDSLDNKDTNETYDSNDTGNAKEQDIKLLPDLSVKPKHTNSYLNLTERETSAGKLKMDYSLESAIELEDRDSEKTTEEIADKDEDSDKHIVHDVNIGVITPPQSAENETTKSFKEDENEDNNKEAEDSNLEPIEQIETSEKIEDLNPIDTSIVQTKEIMTMMAEDDTMGLQDDSELASIDFENINTNEEVVKHIRENLSMTPEESCKSDDVQVLKEDRPSDIFTTEIIKEKYTSNEGDQEVKHKSENPLNEPSKCIDESNTFPSSEEVIEQQNSDNKFEVNLQEFVEEKIIVELDGKIGSNKTGDSTTKESCHLGKENLESANQEMELECESESILESSGNKELIESNGTKIDDEQPVRLIKEKAPLKEDIEDKINLDTPTENNSYTENYKIEDHLNRENSEHEKTPEKNIWEDNEPQEEKLEKDLNVTSEIKESVASSESVETCIQDEISMEIAEERFDKQEKPTPKEEITKHVVPFEKLPDLVAASQDFHDAENDVEPFKREVIKETGELQGIHERNQDNEIPEKDHDSAFSTNEEEREQGEVKETSVTTASSNLEDSLDNKETNETCDSNDTGIAEEKDIKLLPDLSEKPKHTDSCLNLTERETSAGKLKTDYTLESAIELEDRDSEKTTEEIADKDEDSEKHIVHDVNIGVITPPPSAENETTKSFKEDDNEDSNKVVITAEEDTRELIREELDDFKNPSPMFNKEEILQERYKEDEASDELKTDNEEQKISEYVTLVLSSLPDGDEMISESMKECETTELTEQAKHSNLEPIEQIEDLNPTDTSIVQTKEKLALLSEDETKCLQDDSKLASIDFESINTNEQVVKHIHENLSMSPEESFESDDVQVLKEDMTSDIGTAEMIKDKYMSNVGDQEVRHKSENPFTSSEEVIEQENSDNKFEVNLQEFVEEEKILVELDGKNGSNKTTKESCHLEEENLEPANPEMELECESESVPESSGNKALIESNCTKIVENNNSRYQNTESTDQQTFVPEVQKDEVVDLKLNDKNNFTDTESARNDVTLTEEVITETVEVQSCKSFVHEINQDTEISEKDYDEATTTLTKQEREQGEVTETDVTVAVSNLDDNLEKEVRDTHDSNLTVFSKEEDIELLPETMELSERSMSKELEEKESKEIIDEVCKNPKIASMEDDSDKHIVRNESADVVISPQLVGEETSKSYKEGEEENNDNDEVINVRKDTREWIKEETNVFKNQSRLSKEDGTVEESNKEDEVCNEIKIVESRSTDNEKLTIDEYASPVLCSLADEEKVIRESSVECETKANELKEEVEDSPLELKEQVEATTDSTRTPKLETLKDREYITENFEALNPTDTLDAKTLQTENNEILVKPFIFPCETEKGTNVDILEKQEPTINDCETASNAVDTALLKCSKQIEPEKVECGIAYTESDDQSHEIEEHKLMINSVNPILDGTLEKMSLQEENESICLSDDSKLASVDFKISNTNKDVAKYSPEKLSVTSDLSIVDYTCGSEDVGILKKEEASEITPESNTSPLKTLKDEDLSNVVDQEDIFKNEKSLNGASRCVEVLGTSPSSEKDMEQENSAKSFEDLEDVTGEDKIQAELAANIFGEKSLASEIKETPALEQENIELSDPGKELQRASESVPENFGNKTLGETSETEISENEPDVQDYEKVVGEIVGPKLDDEKSNTQSAINREEIPMVYDKIDIKEDIAELIIQNERGITDYHSLYSGDETYHEVEKCDQPQVQTVKNVTSHTDGPPNETTMERLENEKTVEDFPIPIPQVSEEIIDNASTTVVKLDKISGESLLHDITEKAEDRSEPTSVGEGVDVLTCEGTSESMLATTSSHIQDEKIDLAPPEILQATELSSQLEIVNSGEDCSSKDGDMPLITKESNEVAIGTRDNKIPLDFSILVSEVSEENVEQKTIEQGYTYSDKLNPEEGFLNVTKDSTLTETCPEIEGADNMNFDEITNSMSKIPIAECEDVDKETIHVEKQVIDEIENVAKASRVVEETEIPAHVVFETLRSLPMEETNTEEFEKEIEQEKPTMSHTGNIKDDNIEIENSFGIKTGEEKGIQNEPLEEEGDTSTEDSKIDSQEVDPNINNKDSLSIKKNNEPTRKSEQSSQEVSKYKEVFDIDNLNKDDDCPLAAQSQGEGQILDMGKKCEETSDFQCHESGETEIEKARDARRVGLATEGNQSNGNECIKREILNEEITEKRESGMESQQKIVSEETIENINEADKLKAQESPIDKTEDTLRIKQVKREIEELSEETQNVSSSMHILIQNTPEDRAVKDQESVFDERNNESPPSEAVRNNFIEAATELDLENEFDKKYSNLIEKITPHSELALDTEDINYIRETTITESEEDPNTDLTVRQATCPATVEAGRENVEKFAVVNNQEGFMESEKVDDTSHQLPNNGLEVKEALKLDQEIIPETEITYAQEEIPDHQMNIKEDDKNPDLVFDKNIVVESITEEREIVNDEKEQTESKEPLEESTRETDKKTHDADMDETICKSTDESEKPSGFPDIPSLDIAMLQKGSTANLSGANETTQNIKEPAEISDCRSVKQIPEIYHNEIEDTTVATCDKDIQLTDDLEKIEIKKFEPGNSVKVESEQEAVKCDEEKRTYNVDDRNISLSSLLEMSTRETLQMHGQVSGVKEKTRPNEETQTEKADTLQEEGAKTDEEKCEEDEHKNNESMSDSLVMVEISKDTEAKAVPKKHHGFMSGVGSKVKHSISKVKKAITGKSSHSKSTSPK